MSDETIVTEGQESTQEAGAGEGGNAAASVHPAEWRKTQKALRDSQKLIADLQAQIKQREDASLSETEKLRKRVQELDPIAGQYEELRTFAEQKRDAALSALPKEAREHLATVIEGLPAHKALAMIEAVSLVRGEPARAADVPRGGAPKPTRMPTLEQIEANHELLDQLTPEQRKALYGQIGIGTSNKVW